MALVLHVLPSCSGSAATSAVDPSKAECTGQVDELLGPDPVCADNGLRASSLFSFENWAGHEYDSDHFGFEEMLAAFGEKRICRSTDSGQCKVSADGQVIQKMLDDLIANGRCEGLVALGALYATKRGPAPASFGVDTLADLSPEIETFGNVIDYWWSTQFTKGAVEAASSSRTRSLREVLGALIDSLQAGDGATLGLYYKGHGHGVLPVAVTKANDTHFDVHVWDSNAPQELRLVQIDLATGTWIFDKGAQSGDAAESVWTGTGGSIDFTRLADRRGDLAVNIGDSRGDVNVVASGGAQQDLTISIAIANGDSLRISASGTTGNIDGADVTPLKSGEGSQYLVSLPVGVGDIVVSTSVGAAAGGQDTSRVTISDPTHGIVSVAIPADDKVSTTSIKLSGSTDARTAEVTSDGGIELLSSVNDSVVSVPLEPNETATVANDSAAGSDARLTIESVGKPALTSVITPTVQDGVTQQVTIVRASDGTLSQSTQNLPTFAVSRATGVKDVASGVGSDGAGPVVVPDAARATKLSASDSDVTTDSASVTGRISSSQSSTAWFEYQSTQDVGQPVRTERQAVAAGPSESTTATLTGLKAGVTYRYRLAVTVAGFTVYSPWRTFLTEIDAATASTVDPAAISLGAVTVDVTSSSAVLTATVSSPVSGQVFVEYSDRADKGNIRRTASSTFGSGSGKAVVVLVNGLVVETQYQARVVVTVAGNTKYSNWVVFTPKARQVSSPVTTIVRKFTANLKVHHITSTTAIATFTVTSADPGTVQLEYQIAEAGAAISKTELRTFAAGDAGNVDFELQNLNQNQLYSIRAAYTFDDLTAYTRFVSFTTLGQTTTTAPNSLSTTTVPGSPTTTIEPRLFVPSVVDASVRDDKASIEVFVPANAGGYVGLDYGIDNERAVLNQASPKQLDNASRSVTFEITGLEAGIRQRVRVVRVTASGATTRSDFVTFSTTGSARAALYKPVVYKPQRIDGGYRITWGSPRVDVPPAALYRVEVDGKLACDATTTDETCDVTDLTIGMHAITVSAVLESKQVIASDAVNAPVGMPPVVNDFAFVSATSGGMVFTYGFDPRGETVQYGVEVRTRPGNVFVKAQLGGETSDSKSGETLQVTGLSAATTYKARFVIFLGQLMITSDWVDVATTS